MSRDTPPRQILFDPTPEIFATDSSGSFVFPLVCNSEALLETAAFDEVRFVFSIWAPSASSTIDLDRAYAELRGSFDPEEEHWVKLAEIEPVVPPYGAGDSFDGWIGSGFEARSRIQIRASAFFVA
jgi:hypothetical protein